MQMSEISRAEFVREVSEASKEVWVVVLLYKGGIVDSRLLEQIMPRVRNIHAAPPRFQVMSSRACPCSLTCYYYCYYYCCCCCCCRLPPSSRPLNL
ncbi:hypothetical protein EON66_00295 [archaeon]|nr:MAG: hypothetical protein EON66_00295 [archaeon]